ncbi:hypothetical protein FACS18945_1980 [Bacteroidia bacterium]|nr:hypothetical protein FACS18945_1980 [Bacteroidia bacterium]
MKLRFTLFLCFTAIFCANAQRFEWGVNALGFADNREYQSKYQIDQSMFGIRLAPEIGLGFGDNHHLRVGVDVLKEFGREMNKNDVTYTAYYHFQKEPFSFYFGSFPRKLAVGEFPAPFFQDSLTYYCPNINGFVWRYETAQGNASLFLDWTGRQAVNRRESFTAGSAGIYRKDIFYGKYQYYYRHYALSLVSNEEERIHDNGLLHAAVGVDLSEKTFFDTLYINVGYMMGMERRRNVPGKWNVPQGLFVEAQAEWWRIGIKNTLYAGEGLMIFYQTPYNDGGLYLGDPYYQARIYNRTDLYANIIKSNRVKASFDWSFHYDGKRLSSQQQFILVINY